MGQDARIVSLEKFQKGLTWIGFYSVLTDDTQTSGSHSFPAARREISNEKSLDAVKKWNFLLKSLDKHWSDFYVTRIRLSNRLIRRRNSTLSCLGSWFSIRKNLTNRSSQLLSRYYIYTLTSWSKVCHHCLTISKVYSGQLWCGCAISLRCKNMYLAGDGRESKESFNNWREQNKTLSDVQWRREKIKCNSILLMNVICKRTHYFPHSFQHLLSDGKQEDSEWERENIKEHFKGFAGDLTLMLSDKLLIGDLNESRESLQYYWRKMFV